MLSNSFQKSHSSELFWTLLVRGVGRQRGALWGWYWPSARCPRDVGRRLSFSLVGPGWGRTVGSRPVCVDTGTLAGVDAFACPNIPSLLLLPSFYLFLWVVVCSARRSARAVRGLLRAFLYLSIYLLHSASSEVPLRRRDVAMR
jgi:hypothetical protein